VTISADIIADSISPLGIRITTMALAYPRFIHAEFMTHRTFSRGASSSRAIPVKRMLSEVWNHPATPIHWGANQAGMQARAELSGIRKSVAASLWKWVRVGLSVCRCGLCQNLVCINRWLTDYWSRGNIYMSWSLLLIGTTSIIYAAILTLNQRFRN
jgi:hypothetical protein